MNRERVGGYSNIVVGGLMACVLIYVAYALAGPKWGTLITLIGLYESWTLVNSYPEDTISESVWRLAERPLVPWLFGGLSLWMLDSGFLQNKYLIAAWFYLQSHFFFQAQRKTKLAADARLIKAAVTGEAKTDNVTVAHGEVVDAKG